MVDFIAVVVQWVIVPAIILSLFFLAWAIARSMNDREMKTSAWAGFGAGLVIFVIYTASQLESIQEPATDFSGLPGFRPWALLIGFLIGFVPLLIGKLLTTIPPAKPAMPTLLVGTITLLLSASSLSALVTYIFINSLQPSILYGALGISLGILVYIALIPSSVKSLFADKNATGRKSRPSNA
jgi:hypothetical protein